ncbi:MAG: hypothetical protein ACQEQF_12660 [Bacillota bacterium]
MKKGDIIWSAFLVIIVLFLLIPGSREIFKDLTALYPYLMGFIKFSILATMGELLSIRIVNKKWKKPTGLFYRVLIWGFLGIVIVLVFDLFNSGVAAAQSKSLLPGESSKFMLAFLTSALMNMIFAPTMMAFHRISDTYIEKMHKINRKINIEKVVSSINWGDFVSFVILKTIPFFWIPAHTIVFLLPDVYRIITAAFLSMALGAILAFASSR